MFVAQHLTSLTHVYKIKPFVDLWWQDILYETAN